MADLSQPILTQAGNFTIDSSIIPYVRRQEVQFVAHDLKPYVSCNCFFDDILVNEFVQPASVLVTNIGTYSNNFSAGVGLYCNTTHAYCTVIDTSQANLLYVNENYVSLNLVPYGPNNSNSFASSTYNVGDVVYLSTNSPNVESNTFTATVAYWNYNDSSLALKVKNGLPSNTSGNIILYKLGSLQLANVLNVVAGNKFPNTAQVVQTSNVANKFLVSSWSHNHGVFSFAQGNTSQLILNGNPIANAVNSTIYVVSGVGVGQSAKIISLANNVASLNVPLIDPVYATLSTSQAALYAIGSPVVDDVGRVAGVFNIPEDQNLKFQAGNRLFTINDSTTYNSASATMRAISIYAAVGSIASANTTARTPVVSQTPTLTAAANTVTVQSSISSGGSSDTTIGSNNPQATPDPLAQTFIVPTPNSLKQNYGIFCTSIDLFFQSVPTGNSTQFPVTVKIVTTENGFPTTNVLGSATIDWADINVAPGLNVASNVGVYPDSSNSSTYTKFSFSDPVFLSPGTEYAITVYTENPDYKLWVSDIGSPMVNSNRLVSAAPFVGNFFEAQNSSVWNPISNKMLMFVLNKAQFSSTPTTLTFNAKNPIQNTFMDLSFLHSSDITFPIANIDYKMLTTIANTGFKDPTFFDIQPNQIYNYGNDLKISSQSAARRRVIYAGNGSSAQVSVTLYSSDPDISPMFNAERLSLLSITNIINSGSLDAGDISITSPGNHINAANIVVTISAPTGDNGIQATANVPKLSGNSVLSINIVSPGAGYVVSPTITLSEPGAPSNATAVIFGETQQFGGNGYTRYVTRMVTLANGFDSGDLQVFLDAVRPQGTDIQVYYKVMSGSDTANFSSKPWVQMQKYADIFSPDQNSSITLNYVTGNSGQINYVQNGINYPLGGTYKYFAIKIVLFANDPTVPPLVQNYRCLCVPAG